VILAGIKTAAVMSVGTATIAAFIGAGGFGERITTGLALNDNDMLLAGAIPAALLALLTQAGFEAVERLLARRAPAYSDCSAGGGDRAVQDALGCVLALRRDGEAAVVVETQPCSVLLPT
jgi:hypothetical protein